MILRKPYAFFIKYFKVFHIIISVLSIYLMVRMSNISAFINKYLENPLAKLITKDQANSAFNSIDFILPALLTLMSLALWGIMRLKKKPHKTYIFLFASSLFAFVLNVYTHSRIMALTTIWLKSEELTAIVDIYVFGMLLQMATCIICMSRALGFNIAKLDFKSDIVELNADSADNEEFEVALDFDINDVKRDIKKGSRHFKYFVKENNKIIKYGGIALAVLIVLSIAYGAYQNRKIVIKSGILSYNGFTVKVNKAYVIDNDLRGNKLKDDQTLLVVDVDITNNKSESASFLTGTAILNIGDTNYTPSRQFDDAVSDLGIVYNDDQIKEGKTVKRLLVFEIPANRLISKKLFGIRALGYSSSNRGRYYYAKFDIEYYNNKKTNTKDGYKLGDTLDLKDSILGDATFKINTFDIQRRFKVSYNYCYKKDTCIPSTEYIVPQNVLSNYEKVLIKIEGEFNLSNIRFSDFYDLFGNYGYIEYKKNGKTYYQQNNFNQVKSSKNQQKNTYYIEVIKDVLDADSITLGLKVRNIDYKYKLAEGRS